MSPRPSLAAVVLVVLALSAVAVAGAVTQESAGATTPVVNTTTSGPNYLAINESDVQQANTTTITLNVGNAISADSGSIRATYVRLQFEAAYENASTDEARTNVVERFRQRLANATAPLEARSRSNVAAYASGSITADQFLRERARIQSRADQLQGTTSNLRDQLPQDLRNNLNGVHGRLEVLQGPISSTAVDVLRGESEQTTYVEVSTSGYTLASISNEEYTRETYLDEARYPRQPDQFANGTGVLLAAQSRAIELYPWVGDNQAGENAASASGPGIYRVVKGFPGGELRIYLSGGTTDVFREHQTRTLESFNTTQTVNRTVDSVRLTVNRTYETGPAEIRLQDASTGQPIDGTVTVGNRDGASLGGDGREWVVEPRGDVAINVTTGTTNVSTSFSGR